MTPMSGAFLLTRHYLIAIYAASQERMKLICRPNVKIWQMPVSHQDDVVLLLVIQGFDLQRDGLADGIAEHRKALRFFVEE
jgi:hypothetical protein